ncbi:MAG: BlaI/MecI/CopY family transcriptional regulator [Defluviitaleaceae bacterium]|nr:BlaI/MecI/CopY family transcriptional regulator [Defluviitaleaceae bacterium]
MEQMKKLPDAEFDIMKIVWAKKPPITTSEVMKHLTKECKIQTIVSLMQRLTERGFLSSEKKGKERLYFPLVRKDDYLKFESGNFLRQIHDNSFSGLVASLYDGGSLSDADIDELLQWTKERRG